MNRLALLLLLAAASPLQAQVSANISIGSYLEDNDRVGDQT